MAWHTQLRALIPLALVWAMMPLAYAPVAWAQQPAATPLRPAATEPFGLPSRDAEAQAPQVSDPGSSALRGSQTPDETSAPSANQPVDFDKTSLPQESADPDLHGLTAGTSPDALQSLDPDQRPARDRDPFERPAAGYNPLAFQIETLDPIRDRRTRQFFEAETDPFAHVGWRLGSFILFQELEVSPAWDSNVFFSANARSDWHADFRSETRLVSNWSNHALEFRMLHDRSYYRTFSTENDAEQTYELRGRVDITSRTTAEALAAREVRQESRNSIDGAGTATSTRPDVITDRLAATLNHRFNRLSLQLRGGQAETEYDGQTPGTLNDRDVRIRTLAMRAQWEFRPSLSVFGDIELNDRNHAAPTTTDGLSRDSTGERYRAGVALGQTGEYLRGEASIGYGIQRPGATALPDITAFLIDANVAWRVTPLTSVLFEAATTFDETTLAGSPGVVNRRIAARLRHAFTERLTAETGLSYSIQDYPGATLNEQSYTFSTNVEYTLNRHAALFTRYNHIRFRSTTDTRDYDADTILFGARLRN